MTLRIHTATGSLFENEGIEATGLRDTAGFTGKR